MITLNNKPLVVSKFPNGELKIEMPELRSTDNMIYLQYESSDDLMALYFLKCELEQLGINPKLVAYYFPYSRMDRKIENTIFTLKHFTRFINSMNFKSVEILDPHSNVTPALIDRCLVLDYDLNLFVNKVIKKHEIDVVLYPDNGAVKKYAEVLGHKLPYCYGNKKRDLKNGDIESYEIITNGIDLKDKKILIVDDICVKGYTFYNAAKHLKQLGAGDIYLYVTHCEEAIKDGVMINDESIKHVYTTHSTVGDFTGLKVTKMGR